MPFRFSASRNGPFGLCQAEWPRPPHQLGGAHKRGAPYSSRRAPFGNHFADSVSFRFPARQSLDGHPVPSANSAQGMPSRRYVSL